MCGDIIIYVYIALKGSWVASNNLNLSIDLVHEARRHRHLNAHTILLQLGRCCWSWIQYECGYDDDDDYYNRANIMHTETQMWAFCMDAVEKKKKQHSSVWWYYCEEKKSFTIFLTCYWSCFYLKQYTYTI